MWRETPPDVALIGPYPPPGIRHGGTSGVASYTANLAHALAGAGLDPLVVAPAVGGVPERAQDGPVRVLRTFAPGAAAVPRALAAARASGAPVVHLQHELFLYGGPAANAGLLAGLLRRPARTVLTLHQVVDPADVSADYARLHRLAVPAPVARAAIDGLQRALGRLAAATIVHEHAFARHVPGARVIAHGVEPAGPPDTDRASAHSDARSELDLSPGRLVALCFGFVAPYKGLEAALDAAALAGPRVQLVVAGGEHPRLAAQGDRYLDQLRARYAAGGPGRAVAAGGARFTGYVADPQVRTWFRAADVAVLPYPAPHASSGALALAIAYGTPVLMSPRLAEATGADEVCGCPLDPATLATRLLSLGDGRTGTALRERMRAATAALATERSWPVVARAHAELYDQIRRESPSDHGTGAHGLARRRLRAA